MAAGAEAGSAADGLRMGEPAAAVVGLERFEERHWRKLGNSLGGNPVPKTSNNA